MRPAYSYSVFNITAGNDWQEVEVGGLATFITFDILNAPADVEMSYDGENFGDSFTLQTLRPARPMPIAARAFRIRNHTAGWVSSCEAIAYFT